MAERYTYQVKEVSSTPRSKRIRNSGGGNTSIAPNSFGSGSGGASYWTLITKDADDNDLPEDQYYLLAKYTVASEKAVIAYLKRNWENVFPIAGYTAAGIASFNSEQFLVSADGKVSLKKDTGSGTATNIIDGLTSYSVVDALSANQGRILNGKFSDYFTKTEINTKLGTYYTKLETSAAINNALLNYYNKAEIDSLLNNVGSQYFTLVKTDSSGAALSEDKWYLKTRYTLTSEKDIIAYIKENWEGMFPVAGYTAAGIASFNSEHFFITDEGKVSLKNASGGGTATNIIDSLVSYSVVDALSANQGRILNERFNDYFTKTEINTKLGNYYTKLEADSKFSEKFFTLVKTDSSGTALSEDKWYLRTKYTVTSERDIVAYVKENWESILPIAGVNTLGCVKAGSNITIGADGTISATGGSSGGSISVIDNLSSTLTTAALSANQGRVLDAKFSSYVLTSDSRLTNARPASDVYAWAKAATKPSYTYSEVGASPANHIHNYISTIIYSVSGSGNVVTDVTTYGNTVYVTKADISSGGGGVDLSNYVSLDGTQAIRGIKNFVNGAVFSNDGTYYRLEQWMDHFYLFSSESHDNWLILFYNNGGIRVSGQVSCTKLVEISDIRLKNRMGDLGGVLDNIDSIPVFRYTRKDDNFSAISIGTSAQDLRKVYPEFVHEDEDSYLGVSYSTAAFSIAVRGLQEVKAWMNKKEIWCLTKDQQIMRLQQEVNELKQQIEQLKAA